MNLIELLKDDRKNIVSLFTELWHEIKEIECTEQDVVDCERMQIFGRLRDAIVQYADVEKRFFYPAMEEFEETRPLISEAYGDLARIRELVGKMESLRLAGQCDRWDHDLTRLIETLRRHFDREEDVLFPQAMKLLGKARLEQLVLNVAPVRKWQSEARAYESRNTELAIRS
jgi:hemerythrin-like domain-containing protein